MLPFVDALVANNRIDDAGNVWRQAAAQAGIPQPAHAGRPTAWICRGVTCSLPSVEVDQLAPPPPGALR